MVLIIKEADCTAVNTRNSSEVIYLRSVASSFMVYCKHLACRCKCLLALSGCCDWFEVNADHKKKWFLDHVPIGSLVATSFRSRVSRVFVDVYYFPAYLSSLISKSPLAYHGSLKSPQSQQGLVLTQIMFDFLVESVSQASAAQLALSIPSSELQDGSEWVPLRVYPTNRLNKTIDMNILSWLLLTWTTRSATWYGTSFKLTCINCKSLSY
jgi:hypothetical protein